MLKLKLINDSGLSTSKFHSLVKDLGLEVKDDYTDEEAAKIKAAIASPSSSPFPSPQTQSGQVNQAANLAAQNAIAQFQASTVADSQTGMIQLGQAAANAEMGAMFSAYMQQTQSNLKKFEEWKRGFISSQMQVLSHFSGFDAANIPVTQEGFDLPDFDGFTPAHIEVRRQLAAHDGRIADQKRLASH